MGEVRRFRPEDDNATRLAILDEAEQAVAAADEAALVVDFDEAHEEWQREQKPHQVRFRGRTYEVPRNIPSDFGVYYHRHCMGRGGLAGVEPQHVFELVKCVFGDQMSRDILASHTDLIFVTRVMIPRMLAVWGLRKDLQPLKKKATTSTPGSSSGDGATSKPISSASISST